MRTGKLDIQLTRTFVKCTIGFSDAEMQKEGKVHRRLMDNGNELAERLVWEVVEEAKRASCGKFQFPQLLSLLDGGKDAEITFDHTGAEIRILQIVDGNELHKATAWAIINPDAEPMWRIDPALTFVEIYELKSRFWGGDEKTTTQENTK